MPCCPQPALPMDDFLSASALAAAVNAGALSVEEIATKTLALAASLDPLIHAFATLEADRVLAEARDVDARICRNGPLPLAGLPIPIKATQSPDGPLARRLRASGAVLFGTTAVPPRGYHQTWGLTPGGRTRNPWDLERSPGGSSAGAAAAVAAGIVPLATGGDSAGSLRIPAAFCGIVGHKPTVGLLPRRRQGLYRLTVSGALSRTVEDQARFLDVMTTGHIATHLRELRRGLTRTLRAAWSDDLGHVEVNPQLSALARARADALATSGAISWTDVEVKLPPLRDVWGKLRRAERLALSGAPVPTDLVDDESLATRQECLRQLEQLFEDVDILLLPTTPVGAQRVEEDPPGYECELTWAFNVAGLPATSVPAGRTAAGLHAGLQIVGPRGADAVCLLLAAQLERLYGPAAIAPAPTSGEGAGTLTELAPTPKRLDRPSCPSSAER
jgi:amidase